MLIVITATLVVFGVAAVYGSSNVLAVREEQTGSHYALRQLIGAIVGAGAMLAGARLGYRHWKGAARWLLLAAAVALTILLIPFFDFLVVEVQGARRWLGFGGLSVQPSEFAKFAAVCWIASLAAKKGRGVREFKKGVLPFVVVLGPMAGLILFEPALSTTALFVLTGAVMLFASGVRLGYFVVGGVAAVGVAWLSMLINPYQLERWLPGWQVEQSLIGIGSGQLFGVGFGEGTQKMGFLPYAYSDFIFSTIGEEWGFVGSSFLILLFAMFVWIGFRIARTTPNRFGSLMAIGLTTMIGLTALFHVAVTMGIAPTTGLPLPFVSYGRSNLIVSLLAAGVLINIGESRPAERVVV